MKYASKLAELMAPIPVSSRNGSGGAHRGGPEQVEGPRLVVSAPDHISLAASIFALGVLGLVAGDFVAVWQPVPKGTPARESLAYLCAIVCLAAGLALPWKRTALLAARVLLVSFAAWLPAQSAWVYLTGCTYVVGGARRC